MKFREHFMEQMVRPGIDGDDIDSSDLSLYLNEDELPEGNLALRSLWRRCLGVDDLDGSSMTSSRFEATMSMLVFLEIYLKDVTEETSSYARGTKRRLSAPFTSSTSAPGGTCTCTDLCKDLKSFLEPKPEPGASNILEHTYEISQVCLFFNHKY